MLSHNQRIKEEFDHLKELILKEFHSTPIAVCVNTVDGLMNVPLPVVSDDDDDEEEVDEKNEKVSPMSGASEADEEVSKTLINISKKSLERLKEEKQRVSEKLKSILGSCHKYEVGDIPETTQMIFMN